jgi:hypothetical protein
MPEIDLSTAEVICGTCSAPIFVVEGDEDWDDPDPKGRSADPSFGDEENRG